MRGPLLVASTSIAAIACASVAYAQSSTETYTYDALGRLMKVVTTGGQNNGETQSICYDEADNRTQYQADTSAGATGCTSTPTPSPTPSPTPTPTPTPTPGNNPPNTTNDFASASGCNGTLYVNLTANDSDPEGNVPLSLTSIVANQGSASATIISASAVEVVLGGVAFDSSLFTYTVADSLGATSTGQLSVVTGGCGGGGGPPL